MNIKTDEDLCDLITDVDKFNKYIKNIVNTTIETTCRKVLLAIPALVIHHIKNEISYEKIKTTFFEANPELVTHQDILAVKLNDIGAASPEFSIEEIFRLAGIETKKELRKLTEVKNGKGI